MNYTKILFTPLHADYLSFWQSPAWRDILLQSGQAKDVFYFGNEFSFVLVEIRSLGRYQAAFVLGVTTRQLALNERCDFLKSLREYVKTLGCLFLHIESLEERIFPKTRYKYRSFITPYTHQIELTSSEAFLLANMHEKCRYNIRLAERRGVRGEWVMPTQEHIDRWMQLLTETTERDGFYGNSREYYEAFLDIIISRDIGGLLFAYYEGRVIAANIVVFTGSRGIYYYGASSSQKEDKKHMAPYLLQWISLLETKRREIPLYDFLGVADPSNVHDRLKGVTEFKEKFGGTTLQIGYSATYPLNVRGKLFLIFRNIREKIRR